MAKRTDSNHAEICRALRKAGCSIVDLSAVGRGCPDIAVGRMGKTFMLEIKSERGKLNKRQYRFADEWRGHLAVVRSVDEALMAVGLLQN